MIIYGNYIYVAFENRIVQLNYPSGTINNDTWANYTNHPYGMKIIGDYMYIANYNSNTISQLNFPSGTMNNANWTTGLNGPNYLVIFGNYIYVTCGTYVARINLLDQTINTSWAIGLSQSQGLAISGDYMYVANFGGGIIAQYNFPSGTLNNANYVTGLSGIVSVTTDNQYFILPTA